MDVKVINWDIFKHRGFIAICLASVTVSFVTSTIIIHMSAYAQLEAGIHAQKAAILLSVVGIMGKWSCLTFVNRITVANHLI